MLSPSTDSGQACRNTHIEFFRNLLNADSCGAGRYGDTGGESAALSVCSEQKDGLQ